MASENICALFFVISCFISKREHLCSKMDNSHSNLVFLCLIKFKLQVKHGGKKNAEKSVVPNLNLNLNLPPNAEFLHVSRGKLLWYLSISKRKILAFKYQAFGEPATVI